VIRYFSPIIGLLGALAPVLAHAQTNLDQGKSASQIFASACAECHKAAHGLSHGRNSSALADFLGEHYTTNRDQAAALAAYVLGGSGGAPIGAAPQSRGQKPKTEHAGVSTEEAKPSKPLPKRAARTEDGKPATKPRRETHEAAKPKNDAATGEQPSIASPEPGQPSRPTTANRKETKGQPSPIAEPAVDRTSPAAVEPVSTSTEKASTERPSTEKPSQETAPAPAASDTAPTNAASGESGDGAPVPRDNIPD
jgi:mono/diheme cytochrome c family protein